MSEYRVVKDFQVREVPEHLDLRTAALAEPLAVALHAIEQAGGVREKSVLVSGCGPIGLCVVAAAIAKGACSVTAADVIPGPLERASSVGAARTILAGTGAIPRTAYDVVFECSGHPASITTSIEAVKRRGTVAQVGMLANVQVPIVIAPLISKEATLVGCFRFNDEIDEAIALLASDPRIASVITHEFPAAEAVKAWAVAKDSQASGKVLVSLWPDE